MSWRLALADGDAGDFEEPGLAAIDLCFRTGEAYLTQDQDDGTFEVIRLRDSAVVGRIREVPVVPPVNLRPRLRLAFYAAIFLGLAALLGLLLSVAL